ncbi:MAG: glucose 1-dehydrogenase [Actinomycetota bacterium]
MEVDLAGKAAIVTGAGRGIGRAYAEALAASGAAVAVADIDAAGGEETVKLIAEAGGRAIFLQIDVSHEESTRVMATATADHFGGVDILVNNAGIWGGLTPVPIGELPLDRWNKIMSVNLTGMFLCARAAAPFMMERGGGAIVNQSSIGAYTGGPKMADYCTSKGAVGALTKTLARAYGPQGIRVNAVAPGSIATEATIEILSDQGVERFVDQQCIKRAGQADDLTGPLLFLVSDQSKFVTGQVLVVDGGIVMQG